MKKRYAFLAAVVVSGIVGLWIAQNRREATDGPTDATIAEVKQEVPTPITKTPSQELESQTTQTPQNPPMSASELVSYGQRAIAEQAARNKDFQEKWNAQWATPITFYGKVVDENDKPLAGATIQFEWANIQGEAQHAIASSGSTGGFSLTGIKGQGLRVDVAKEGYYTSKRLNQTSFLYADMTGGGTFTPDQANPVIFHLRKKGTGTELTTSQSGVSPLLEAKIPRDGTPVQIDLLNRKVGADGQVAVSQTKPAYENWKQATEWTFRMEIPNGGFAEQDDEFPFEAPEGGYQPVVAFNFQTGLANWAHDLRKDYYIKFGIPPRFGRLHVETDIMWGSAQLTYARICPAFS